jgi:hypothetical protein
MNINELLTELDQASGPDLEHKLVALVARLHPDHSEVDPDKIIDLRNQIDDLKLLNDRLEQTVIELRTQMVQNSPLPINETYTIEQFMLALATKLGRTYGWRTDYALATKNTPGCHEVNTDDIQRWQKQRRVPDWAFAQIDALHYRIRIGHSNPEWKPDEVQYLIDLYRADPHESNASLAAKCKLRFGRDINEQSIKGAVYRLGRQGRLPQHRSR